MVSLHTSARAPAAFCRQALHITAPPPAYAPAGVAARPRGVAAQSMWHGLLGGSRRPPSWRHGKHVWPSRHVARRYHRYSVGFQEGLGGGGISGAYQSNDEAAQRSQRWW
jgi:hypothetical protein